MMGAELIRVNIDWAEAYGWKCAFCGGDIDHLTEERDEEEGYAEDSYTCQDKGGELCDGSYFMVRWSLTEDGDNGDALTLARWIDIEADERYTVPATLFRPRIVCLCGSTRFSEAFQKANLEETLAGRIVLTIGCDMRSDADLFTSKTDAEREQVKRDLDALHLEKIYLADEVLILNVGGYIGESTRRELEYARRVDKKVRFLEPEVISS